jgi:CspA family cold shock protein
MVWAICFARKGDVTDCAVAVYPYHKHDGGSHMSDERVTGTVKWFNDTKGFGFIAPDAGGSDVFVHYSALQSDGYRTLAEGQRVEFAVRQGDKGLAAVDVVKLA